MKAIHNPHGITYRIAQVVLYPKDTEKWKQFTTTQGLSFGIKKLFCIPKILKNESNSQLLSPLSSINKCCFVSQRYWKMKAIHNYTAKGFWMFYVVLYPKDTEKWKQFTTGFATIDAFCLLFCIPKILKNESNSQQRYLERPNEIGCFVSQRYWKMKAIHNGFII